MIRARTGRFAGPPIPGLDAAVATYIRLWPGQWTTSSLASHMHTDASWVVTCVERLQSVGRVGQTHPHGRGLLWPLDDEARLDAVRAHVEAQVERLPRG